MNKEAFNHGYNEVIKQADWTEDLGKFYQDNYHIINPGAGAAVGALGGAMIPQDEKKNNRVRNSILGGLAGAGLGFGANGAVSSNNKFDLIEQMSSMVSPGYLPKTERPGIADIINDNYKRPHQLYQNMPGSVESVIRQSSKWEKPTQDQQIILDLLRGAANG